MQKRKALYNDHRLPAVVISQAVRWYFRFQLSLRDIEELLFERGVVVSDGTIRRWPPVSASGACEDFAGLSARSPFSRASVSSASISPSSAICCTARIALSQTGRAIRSMAPVHRLRPKSVRRLLSDRPFASFATRHYQRDKAVASAATDARRLMLFRCLGSFAVLAVLVFSCHPLDFSPCRLG